MAISKVGNKVKYLAGSPHPRLKQHSAGSASGGSNVFKLDTSSDLGGYRSEADYTGKGIKTSRAERSSAKATPKKAKSKAPAKGKGK